MAEAPRRVLLVSHVGEMSGAEHSLLLLATGLDPARWQVTVALPRVDSPLGQALGQRSIALEVVRGLAPLGRSVASPARWLVGSRSLQQLVLRLRPELIHANTDVAMAFALGSASLAPTIWHIRDLRQLGRLGATLLHRSAARIAVSQASAERYGLRLGPRDRVIANGVDLRRFHPTDDRAGAKRALGLDPSRPVALSIGQDCTWKRHEDFLALDVPGLQRVLVRYPAPGTRRARPAAVAREALLLPYRERVEEIYAASDLYVHPAVGEAFGRTVLEALACGLPVVCRDEGGPAELVEHGVSGLVAGSAEQLGDAVRQLAEDGERRALMARAARTRAEDFSAERTTSQVESLYEDLLDDEGGDD